MEGLIMKKNVAVIGAAMIVAAVPSHAASVVEAQQAMRELNLIVFGDMNGASNVEGKAFIGGNLTNGTQFGVGRSNPGQSLAPSDRPTLTVLGNASGNSIQLQNGSNGGAGLVGTPPGVVVGGNLGGNGMNMNAQNAVVRVGGNASGVNGSNGSTITTGGSFSGNLNGAALSANQGAGFRNALVAEVTAERDALVANLSHFSNALADLEATSGNSTAVFGSRLTFNAVDGGRGFSVFNMDAAFLSGFGEFDMVLANPGLRVIVNIATPGSYQWNQNAIGGLNASLNDNIIWNFADTTSLTLNRQIQGSVLAPFAAVRNFADLEGTLVAASFVQGGQLHLGTYGGDLPERFGVIPEPAAWCLMIAGFGLVGSALRRRPALA